MLTVSEHIAIVQRAQAIAVTDHAALVQAQGELADARAELKQLRRRTRRRAPVISGRRGLGRMRGRDDDALAGAAGRHARRDVAAARRAGQARVPLRPAGPTGSRHGAGCFHPD